MDKRKCDAIILKMHSGDGYFKKALKEQDYHMREGRQPHPYGFRTTISIANCVCGIALHPYVFRTTPFPLFLLLTLINLDLKYDINSLLATSHSDNEYINDF